MSANAWPWDALDLPRAPETTAEVRRAYAKRLKTIDQAKDIAGFEALRKAYEAALQRVEQKARNAAAKAAGKAIAARPALNDIGSVDGAPAPSAPDTDHRSAPEGHAADARQPTAFPDPLPIQSPEDRLRLRLNLLSEKNILMSPNAQVQAILDEPEFQSPELEPMLRHGLAEYIRSQFHRDELGDPYLRRSGVSADLLYALNARFGWLDDYSAFRRDFLGDTHLLEAMVETAGLGKTRQIAVQTKKSGLWGGFALFVGYWYFFLFFGCLATLNWIASAMAELTGGLVDEIILDCVLFLPVAHALSSGHKMGVLFWKLSGWQALPAAWIGSGGIAFLLGASHLFWETGLEWPLRFWLAISFTILFRRWILALWFLLVAQNRNRQRRRLN